MNLGEVSWREAAEAEASVALLPTGSTEQHGPHLPLETDSLAAEAFAAGAAERSADAVCLPSVEVGVSREHAAFDGSLWVSPDVFRGYVREVLDSASRWFDAAVAVNGHGGNVTALQEVCAGLTRDEALLATEWTWWNALDRDDMGHAGKLETSLILYLSDVRCPPEDGVEAWGRYVEGSQVAYDVEEWSEDGVVGAASEASVELGEELYREGVESLERLVDELADEL